MDRGAHRTHAVLQVPLVLLLLKLLLLLLLKLLLSLLLLLLQNAELCRLSPALCFLLLLLLLLWRLSRNSSRGETVIVLARGDVVVVLLLLLRPMVRGMVEAVGSLRQWRRGTCSSTVAVVAVASLSHSSSSRGRGLKEVTLCAESIGGIVECVVARWTGIYKKTEIKSLL